MQNNLSHSPCNVYTRKGPKQVYNFEFFEQKYEKFRFYSTAARLVFHTIPARTETSDISWDEIVHSMFSSCHVSQPVTTHHYIQISVSQYSSSVHETDDNSDAQFSIQPSQFRHSEDGRSTFARNVETLPLHGAQTPKYDHHLNYTIFLVFVNRFYFQLFQHFLTF
jgi:hypothetical protein